MTPCVLRVGPYLARHSLCWLYELNAVRLNHPFQLEGPLTANAIPCLTPRAVMKPQSHDTHLSRQFQLQYGRQPGIMQPGWKPTRCEISASQSLPCYNAAILFFSKRWSSCGRSRYAWHRVSSYQREQQVYLYPVCLPAHGAVKATQRQTAQ